MVLSYDKLVRFVLEQLPADEPFVLVAESFSGPIALRVAAQDPPGLRGVVLCATFIRSPAPFSRALAAAVRPVWFAQYASLPAAAALMTRRVLGSKGRHLQGLLVDAVDSVAPEVMAGRARDVLLVDASDALVACPCPILYIRATRDLAVRRASLKRILRLRPDVAVEAVDAPHLALQVAPERCGQVLGRFLATLRQS